MADKKKARTATPVRALLIGSTDDVRYETTKTCFPTTKSHLNLVVEDSRWESKLADVLPHHGHSGRVLPLEVLMAASQAFIPRDRLSWPTR